VKISNGSGSPECSCKDWIRWHIPCKLMFTVFSYMEWAWSDLPSSYLHNAYLSADSEALNFAVSDYDCNDDDGDNGDDECAAPIYNVVDSKYGRHYSYAIEYSHKLPKHKVGWCCR